MASDRASRRGLFCIAVPLLAARGSRAPVHALLIAVGCRRNRWCAPAYCVEGASPCVLPGGTWARAVRSDGG